MKNLTNQLQNLGIDGWVFGLTGIAAIVISIISFVGISLPLNQTIQITLGAVGALMLTVVSLMSRRHSELSELKNALGMVDAQLLNAKDFGRHLVTNILNTKSYVSDTALNQSPPVPRSRSYFSGSQANYKRILYERLRKKEITFRVVEVIPDVQRLDSMIFRLLLHERLPYYVRYYELAPSMPVLGMMSFDDKTFVIGGFYSRDSARESHALCLRESGVEHLLKDYWSMLWEKAKPANEGGIINWAILRQLGLNLGMTEEEFDKMVFAAREDVKKEKQQ